MAREEGRFRCFERGIRARGCVIQDNVRPSPSHSSSRRNIQTSPQDGYTPQHSFYPSINLQYFKIIALKMIQKQHKTFTTFLNVKMLLFFSERHLLTETHRSPPQYLIAMPEHTPGRRKFKKIIQKCCMWGFKSVENMSSFQKPHQLYF